MKKNVNILNKISLFFMPMKKNKVVYWIGIFLYFIRWLDKVIHILFLEKIIYSLENWYNENFTYILKIYFCYIIIYILFMIILRKKWRTEISDKAIIYLQNIYYKKFVTLDNNILEREWTWKLISILNTGIDKWWRLLDIFLMNGFTIITSIIFTWYMISKNNLNMLFIFIWLYILLYVISYYLNLWALKYRRLRRDYWNTHTKNVVKIIMNKNEIMQSQKINHEINILDEYKEKEIFYNKKMSRFLMPLFELPNVLISFIILFMFYYLWNKFIAWDIALSWLIWLISALLLMQRSVEAWLIFFKDFTKEFTDVEKLWDFFDNAPQIQWYEEWKEFSHKKWEIEIKNMNFWYVEWKNIFHDFSLNIAWEKVLALVGDSGSWKSTLAKMIAGYMRPTSWEIIIDNQKLSETSLKSYYADIWYLTQDPSVFDGSILENFTYALEEKVSDEKISEIITQAKCEFIYDLPNGLDTQIWERGVKLSWGQKQRLAIAKIFLKDPKIIILDEPTSALDSFSEEQITKAMKNLFENRTVIVIAHRLQTVKHADRILVLEDGKIKEDGTHDELVKQEWKYAKMLELQSGF